MKIELEKIRNAGEWEDLLNNFKYKSFFLGRAWVEAICKGYPAKKLVAVTARDHTGKLETVLPAVEWTTGPFLHRQSMPFGTYGGILGHRDPALTREMVTFFFPPDYIH